MGARAPCEFSMSQAMKTIQLKELKPMKGSRPFGDKSFCDASRAKTATDAAMIGGRPKPYIGKARPVETPMFLTLRFEFLAELL